MILITTATQTEAKPLIDFFKLKKIDQAPISIYQNEKIFLIVTNIGKYSCMCAISFFFGKFSKTKITGAINIGVAGHKNAPIGDAFLVHKVKDSETKEIIFPSIPFKWDSRTADLITFEKPNLDYSIDTLMDMEGFGFFFACLKFLKVDVVHSLKVVSDNQQFTADKIDKNRICILIKNQLPALQALIEKLFTINAKLPSDCKIDASPYLKLAHYTETEKIQLIDLLKRAKILDLRPNTEKLIKLNNAKKIIKALKEHIFNGYRLR